MPQVFTAFASEVKVNEETVEGLQSIEYSLVKNRQHVGAIGQCYFVSSAKAPFQSSGGGFSR